MRLPAQVALLVACLAGSILVAQLQEKPRTLHYAAWDTDEGRWTPTGVSWRSHVAMPANATHAWDGTPFVVGMLQPIAYNATRDATLAGAMVCSHAPCGPLLWIRGNVTGAKPFLLRPSADTLTFEDLSPPRQEAPPPSSGPMAVTPPTPSTWHGPGSVGWGNVRFAIAEPFDASPTEPVALGAAALRVAPLLLLAFVPGRAPGWQHALILGGAVAGAWLAYGIHADPWAGLFYGFPIILLTLVSAVGLLVVAAMRRRASVFATAGLALGFAFFGALSILAAYAPVVGGE